MNFPFPRTFHTDVVAFNSSRNRAVVFDEGTGPIEFLAATDSAFVLGSAAKHQYDLVTGYFSVHTNAEALRQGEKNISTIGHRLHNQGVLGSAARRFSAGAAS